MIFGISGFVSLAYEVLWTRLLTPSSGTYVYAFALILGLVLFGIAAGSLIFRFFYQKSLRFFFLGLQN